MNKEIKKQKIEGLLAIFLGSFGAHNFYRGEIGAGILRIILSWGGLAILASPLPSMMVPDNIGDALVHAVIFIHIIIPIVIGAPVISIIEGIKEGIKILQHSNSASKKEQALAVNQDRDNLQLKQDNTTGIINIQDIYPNPKNNNFSDENINTKKDN